MSSSSSTANKESQNFIFKPLQTTTTKKASFKTVAPKGSSDKLKKKIVIEEDNSETVKNNSNLDKNCDINNSDKLKCQEFLQNKKKYLSDVEIADLLNILS